MSAIGSLDCREILGPLYAATRKPAMRRLTGGASEGASEVADRQLARSCYLRQRNVAGEFDLRYSEFRHARSFAAIEVVLMLERAS
jgi:hypothetical protein